MNCWKNACVYYKKRYTQQSDSFVRKLKREWFNKSAADGCRYDERVVEKAIVNNVKNFITTFGRDFAFVGNQYHLEKFGHDEYPDLLFYNRELMALVAVELKQGATYAKRWKRGKHPPISF